jgi:hypothetical protein
MGFQNPRNFALSPPISRREPKFLGTIFGSLGTVAIGGFLRGSVVEKPT